MNTLQRSNAFCSSPEELKHVLIQMNERLVPKETGAALVQK